MLHRVTAGSGYLALSFQASVLRNVGPTPASNHRVLGVVVKVGWVATRVELIQAIRRDAWVEGLSIRDWAARIRCIDARCGRRRRRAMLRQR